MYPKIELKLTINVIQGGKPKEATYVGGTNYKKAKNVRIGRLNIFF